MNRVRRMNDRQQKSRPKTGNVTKKGSVEKIRASCFFGAPGMGNDLAVKVRYRLGSRNC